MGMVTCNIGNSCLFSLFVTHKGACITLKDWVLGGLACPKPAVSDYFFDWLKAC